eukprot:jgi/Psemu1/11707/gm1.11707_g
MVNVVVAISDGAAVTVNKPSVTEGGANESFSTSTESTCSIPTEEEDIEAGSPNPGPFRSGPFSGFRQRRAERISARISRREEQKKVDEAIPERLIEPDLESLRAGRISVTVVKNESNSYGMGLAQVPRKKNTVKIDALVKEGNGLLCQSPLREGDILKTVNNQVVAEYRPVMLQLMKMDGPVTISVETPAPQGNPAVVQAFCRKPSPDIDIGIEFHVVDHSTTQNELCRDHSGSKEVATTKLLQVKSVDAGGFLAHSSLSPGDFVLAINEKPCAVTSAEDATAMIRESESTVNILALNPKLAQEYCSPTRAQRWLRRARRAGVGVAGGTMLGLGLIMIPLPFPPPFGEVLVLGGVSVLGREFEAPKRVVRTARNALQNAVQGNDKTVGMEQLRQMESVAGDDDGTNTNKSTDDPSETAGEPEPEPEPVVLRESFLTMISERQMQVEEDPLPGTATATAGDDSETSDGAAALIVEDCWSQANIENMYSGTEHDLPPSPTGTRQFLKKVGRKVVLPFLDHVVGDPKRDGDGENPEKSVSKAAATEGGSPADSASKILEEDKPTTELNDSSQSS